MKLKQQDIAAHRELLFSLQDGSDPIGDFQIIDPVLDHDHGTGHCRACLDRRTNAWEGKVKNSFKRCGLEKMGVDYPAALRRLAAYVERDWSGAPLHPKHKTDAEKRTARNRKARLARKRTKMKAKK